MPLWSNHTIYQRLCHSPQRYHAYCRYKHRHLYHSAITFNHPLLVILQLTQNWIAHSLNDSRKIRREDACILVAFSKLTKCSGVITFSHNHLIQLIPDVVEQSADKEFPSEAPHIMEALRRELEFWPPFVEHPKAEGIE